MEEIYRLYIGYAPDCTTTAAATATATAATCPPHPVPVSHRGKMRVACRVFNGLVLAVARHRC